MATIVSVSYARTAGANFNMDYYLSSHMRLVSKTWAKYGLKSWTVYENAADSSDWVTCLLFWESIDAFNKAVEAESEPVMADIKNYTTIEAKITVVGEVKESGEA